MRISVLMAAYNSEKYIEDAIDSALKQMNQEDELVIVDDGSSDSTPRIVSSTQEKDDRVKPVFLDVNQGQTKALNIGLSACKGRYIARLDADDLCIENRFEAQYRFMEDNSNYAFVGCGASRVSDNGRDLGPWHPPPSDHLDFIDRLTSFGPVCPHSGFFIRKTAIDAVGGYDDHQSRAQDLDLLLRMSEKGFLFAALPQALVALRMHPRNVSYGSGAELQLVHAVYALSAHFLREVETVNVDRRRLEKTVRKVIRDIGLDTLYSAQRSMVRAYLSIMERQILDGFRHAVHAMMVDPRCVFKANQISRLKLEAARRTADEFV